MIPSRNERKPLSKRQKMISFIVFGCLAFLIVGGSLAGMWNDTHRSYEYEPAATETETTSEEETALSYEDQDYKEWYNEFYDEWYDCARRANDYFTQYSKGDDSALQPLLEEIEIAVEMTKEINNQPVPTDPDLKKLDDDLRDGADWPFQMRVNLKEME